MRDLIDKVFNSDNLGCYLVMVLETGAAASHIVLVHSIGKYSRGFGALTTFQGTIMAFIGETIGDSLPLLMQAPINTAINRTLILAFALQQVVVPSKAETVTYFTSVGDGNLMNLIVMMATKTTVQLMCLCPPLTRHGKSVASSLPLWTPPMKEIESCPLSIGCKQYVSNKDMRRVIGTSAGWIQAGQRSPRMCG
jgi:hypothetical protein